MKKASHGSFLDVVAIMEITVLHTVDSGLWSNKIMLSKHMHGQKLNQIQIEQKKALNFSTKI